MALAKPAGTWAYADLTALPDDGRRFEVIGGDLYELTDATWPHAAAIAGLFELLLPLIDGLGGTLLTGPLDVFFDTADPVEPDILVFFPNGRARAARHGIVGPPDLLIEVVTPSNRAHDQVRKRELYARGGVREYWIVDPEHRVIEVVNERGVTVHRVSDDAEPVLHSHLLGDLELSLDAMFPAADSEA